LTKTPQGYCDISAFQSLGVWLRQKSRLTALDLSSSSSTTTTTSGDGGGPTVIGHEEGGELALDISIMRTLQYLNLSDTVLLH